MLSHLHKCFDDRIISIHPETRRIRAFADYDILTQYHGQLAHLPAYIDSKALRHHWDMCCLENMRSCWLVQEPDPKTLVLAPVPRVPLSGDVDHSGQSPVTQNPQQPTPQAQAPFANPQRPNRPASPEDRSPHLDPQDLSPTCDPEARPRHSSRKTGNPRAHPPSPPSSEVGPEKRALWWFGDEVIDDQADADALMQKGWLLQPISEDDAASKSVRRALNRRHRQRAGERQLWWCGNEVIDNAAEAEALTKQGWLLQPINEEDDEEESEDEREQRGDDDPDAQSEPADGRPHWRLGAVVIKDPDRAEDLMKQGWLLQTVDVYIQEQDRGRSLKKRRCVSTDVDEGLDATEPDGAHRDSAPGTKRQRLT